LCSRNRFICIRILSTLFINNEVLAVPTTKFKVPPSHCLSLKAVFQVAALVILASAKVPAQPTVIVVAANKAINGEPPRALYLCHPL
jgi:hypothetical protein